MSTDTAIYTDEQLAQAIQASQDAKERIHALEALKEQADQLARLEQEQERRARIAAAQARVDPAIDAARSELSGASEQLAVWRDKFERVAPIVAELIEDLPAIERRIIDAGRPVKRARSQLAYAQAEPGRQGTGPLDGPLGLDWSNDWARAGGNDDGLGLRYDGLAGELLEFIEERVRVAVYDPKHGVGQLENIYRW